MRPCTLRSVRVISFGFCFKYLERLRISSCRMSSKTCDRMRTVYSSLLFLRNTWHAVCVVQMLCTAIMVYDIDVSSNLWIGPITGRMLPSCM